MTSAITPSEMGAHCEQAAKNLTLEHWFLIKILEPARESIRNKNILPEPLSKCNQVLELNFCVYWNFLGGDPRGRQ